VKAALAITVLSFNVWGVPYIAPERSARMAEIGSRAAKLAPDVVTMQEVWDPTDAATLSHALAAAGLEHHHYFGSSEQSSGLWVASRFPIDSVRFIPFELGDKPLIPWHLDYMAMKGVGIVRLLTPFGPIEVANTHMQASYLVGDYSFVQLGQALQIGELLGVNHHEPAAPPLIAAGDFNSRPNSLPFRTLSTRAGLVPAADDFDIDAILARPGKEMHLIAHGVEQVMLDRVVLPSGKHRPLSDHPALLARYELAPCSNCVTATLGSARWRSVAAEARAFFADSHNPSRVIMWLDRVLTFGLAAVALWIARRRRKRRSVMRKVARVTVVTALLGTSCWLAYWGWDFDPHKLEVLGAQERRIARPR